MTTPPFELRPRAWLITNHAPLQIVSDYHAIPAGDDIIAVDNGLAKVHELGLTPRVIIGDFDSVDSGLLASYAEIPMIRHPSAKNETDTELALTWCINLQRYSEIVICNDLQGRWDHSLALLQNLLFAHSQGVSCRIESRDQIARLITSRASIPGKQGDLLSLIALAEDAVFHGSKGLVFPLEHVILKPQQSRGISNVFSADRAELLLEKGLVLSVQTIL